MKSKPEIIPRASIHPHKINLYNEVVWPAGRPVSRYSQEKNAFTGQKFEHLLDSKRSAQGKVSPIARRKMLKSLDYLLFVTKEKTVSTNYNGRKFAMKIAFVTLTLPSKQVHSDNEIKNTCLNQLIIELKKYYHVKNYIWRAEKQKNGNLHFHIVVNKFIPYQELRDRWNRIINKLGYVDSYRDSQMDFHHNGFRLRKNLLPTWSAKKQKQAFERGAKTHWNSPNTTDIHSIRKIRDIKSYMAKYLSKDEIKQAIEQKKDINLLLVSGRIWGCNQELSNIKGAQALIQGDVQDEIETILSASDIKIFKNPYFTVIYFDIQHLFKYPQSALFKLFSTYILENFNYNIQAEIAA